MRNYAIGDIHGQLDRLREAHALIAADRLRTGDAAAPVIHVGDLVDRGPDSRGVIDHLIAGLDAGAPWVVLKGNHDRMFSGFLDDFDYQDKGLRPELHWFDARLGGAATLASYGVGGVGERFISDIHAEALAKVPARHRAFLADLPLFHIGGAALFVHAGIRPGVDLHDQTADDLLWIRRDFLEDARDHGALVVHGHTVVDEPMHYGNRLNIDSGAGYGRALSAVVIEGRDAWLLTGTGRVAIVPRLQAGQETASRP